MYLEYQWDTSKDEWHRMEDKTGSALIFSNADQRWGAGAVLLANPMVTAIRWINAND